LVLAGFPPACFFGTRWLSACLFFGYSLAFSLPVLLVLVAFQPACFLVTFPPQLVTRWLLAFSLPVFWFFFPPRAESAKTGTCLPQA
jgi:hypothetical protein